MTIQDLLLPLIAVITAILFFRRNRKDSLSEGLPTSNDSIGQTEPICPYCSNGLAKMPGRKKKCPSCGNFIFVRTHPKTKKKILVREEQLERIEELQAIADGVHDQFIASRKARVTEIERLQRELGREPSEEEVSVALRLRRFAIGHKRRMREFKDCDGFVTGVEISAIDDARTCEHCRKISGKKFILTDVPDLPYEKCTSHMGCRCIAVPITRID